MFHPWSPEGHEDWGFFLDFTGWMTIARDTYGLRRPALDVADAQACVHVARSQLTLLSGSRPNYRITGRRCGATQAPEFEPNESDLSNTVGGRRRRRRRTPRFRRIGFGRRGDRLFRFAEKPRRPMPHSLNIAPALAFRMAMAAFLLAVAGCGTSSVLSIPDQSTSVVILDEQSAAAAISRYRGQHGLGPVAIDSSLIRAASYQAGVNAKAGRLSHEIGGGFETRIADTGFGRAYAAENLSAGSATFEEVLARWKASPEHNKNMLLPQLKRIGIARVDAPGTRYKRFWALVMAGG